MKPSQPHRGNILLVDDTPNNLRLLSAMLGEQGYEVRRVVNGQMALKTAQANPPDLILLDIKMPDMNGYEVCQRLKADMETQDIPVIFISALDEVFDKMKAFAVGGVDYISKPFSEEEVFARVENILTIRQLQQQIKQLQPGGIHSMMQPGKLFFFCGKMAAGKSTLAKEIAEREDAILIVQDDFLSQLFPGKIVDIPSFVEYSSRLKDALAAHIGSLLLKGLCVVLDFPGNTRTQRAWFRELLECTGANHELHYVDATDELCKRQLRARSEKLPEGSAFTSDDEFDAIMKYFQAPLEDENFNVIRHERSVTLPSL
jgi:CheY-like chemotaxis protein/predicted kinase